MVKERHLFLDDTLCASREGVELVMNPPVKRGPVLVPDRPWESFCVGAFGTVLEDAGEYRMYYRAIDHEGNWALALATSTDGVNWEKPDLGVVEYQGSRANNLTTLPPDGTVFLDPSAPPEQRWKCIGDRWLEGVWAFYSADGLVWERAPGPVLPLDPDTQNQAFYDLRLRRYVAYLRGYPYAQAEGQEILRAVVRLELDDVLAPWPYTPREERFAWWSGEQLPPPSTEFPAVMCADDEDPPHTDLYNPCVMQYLPEAYFAFPSAYRHWPEPPEGARPNDGLLDLQMAVSRDGTSWKRFRQPYVGLGQPGSGESAALYMLVGALEQGGSLYQYYCGYDFSHGDDSPERWRNQGVICRLEQRRDGFVSADFAYPGGVLETAALTVTGGKLEVNLEASALGALRVELLSEGGAPLPGYGRRDCDSLEGNDLARTVSWRGREDLSALEGSLVRLRLEGRSAKLYALQFR